MITYLIKTLLCAAILFLIYILLLEREKMYRFNRFYLLFSIAFSFGVSFITIKGQSPVVSVNEMIVPVTQMNTMSDTPVLRHAPETTIVSEKGNPFSNIQFSLSTWLLIFYIAGTGFLLVRFIINLSTLLLKAFRNKSIAFHNAKLILTSDDTVPHSFLKYIFIDKNNYEQGAIEKEILQHELTHVEQKHSIDILMVELLMVFAWINPLLYLYRKAIMLNHEYLADEAVLNTFNDAKSYQLLLFNKVNQNNVLVLSSPFNHLITKKRLIMMTRKTSQRVAIVKQIAVIPLIAAIGFLFSTRTIAQDKSKQPAAKEQFVASKTDAPQSVIDEYHTILLKLKINTQIAMGSYDPGVSNTFPEMREWQKVNHLDTLGKLEKSDRDRLEQLYFQMSEKQQCHQIVSFWKKSEILQKLVPTKAQMELWKNPAKYGIWINGRRAKNTVLNNHSNSDFNYYVLRELDRDAAKIMKYQIEVALMTKANFNNHNSQATMLWKKDQYKTQIGFMITSKKGLVKIDAGK